jgi:hypothetical protein
MIMSRSVFATCLAKGILRDSEVRGRGAPVAAGFGPATCSIDLSASPHQTLVAI